MRTLAATIARVIRATQCRRTTAPRGASDEARDEAGREGTGTGAAAASETGTGAAFMIGAGAASWYRTGAISR